MAQPAATTVPATGIDLGGGSGYGTTPLIASDDKGAAPGLHTAEEADDDDTGVGNDSAPLPGIGGACYGGAGRVCGGVGIGARADARRHERRDAGLGEPAACLTGKLTMIQITPQMRVMVAIEPVDGRKGIDSLARLCQDKLAEDPFSGCVFVFRSRSGAAIRLLSYDGQGYWLAQKRLSRGRFCWWPEASEAAKRLEAYEAQLLMAAGDVSRVCAALMWRRVDAAR